MIKYYLTEDNLMSECIEWEYVGNIIIVYDYISPVETIYSIIFKIQE